MNVHNVRSDHESNPGFAVVPTLHVALHVWQKMMAFVLACPIEINGFGYIDRVGNDFYIEDVFILDQTATPTGVEVSTEAIHRHLYEMTRDGHDAGRMRFQWHSHVNFGAYFSGTDLRNIENYTGDWMISLVANKLGEFQLQLDVFKPFRVWTPVMLRIEAPVDPAIAEFCQGEIQSKVRTQGVWRRSRVSTESVAVAPLDSSVLELEADNAS